MDEHIQGNAKNRNVAVKASSGRAPSSTAVAPIVKSENDVRRWCGGYSPPSPSGCTWASDSYCVRGNEDQSSCPSKTSTFTRRYVHCCVHFNSVKVGDSCLKRDSYSTSSETTRRITNDCPTINEHLVACLSTCPAERHRLATLYDLA